jgi:hypothetical protein
MIVGWANHQQAKGKLLRRSLSVTRGKEAAYGRQCHCNKS